MADLLFKQSLEEKRGELLLARAQEYRAHFEREGLRALQDRFEERARYTDEAFFIRVVAPAGRVLFFKFPEPEQQFDLRVLDEERDWTKRQWIRIDSAEAKGDWLLLSIPLRQDRLLQLGHHQPADDADRDILKRIFINLFVPFLIVALLGGWLLTSQAIQPIRKLLQTIKEILRTGRLETRVPEKGVTEDLRELIEIFNRLLDQNQKLIMAMNQSLDNVAHDLKTPMARFRASAEMALQSDSNPEDYREALQDCLEESDRILTMLNVLMDVSEAQTGAMRLKKERILISEIAKQVLEIFEFSAEEKDIRLECELVSESPILGDRVRLQQVLSNLVDNAIKYSGEGKSVVVRITKVREDLVVEVLDEGIGIPADEIPRIWERLYRGDRSRSQRGLGLGLSFVKAIVEAHEASIHVESELSKGSRFILRFKVA